MLGVSLGITFDTRNPLLYSYIQVVGSVNMVRSPPTNITPSHTYTHYFPVFLIGRRRRRVHTIHRRRVNTILGF